MTYDPYAIAYPAPAFAVTSTDFTNGGPLPPSAYQPADESPELSWSSLPEGTRSLVVTAFDADAPIPGGLWHWLLKDVPAGRDDLPHAAQGIGTPMTNSLGRPGYTGAKPPPGSGIHRVFVCVTALNVDTLDLPADASTALLNIALIPHTVGRAILIGTSRPTT